MLICPPHTITKYMRFLFDAVKSSEMEEPLIEKFLRGGQIDLDDGVPVVSAPASGRALRGEFELMHVAP